MMIVILAAAMTMTMLVATLVAMHNEAERKALAEKSKQISGFGV